MQSSTSPSLDHDVASDSGIPLNEPGLEGSTATPFEIAFSHLLAIDSSDSMHRNLGPDALLAQLEVFSQLLHGLLDRGRFSNSAMSKFLDTSTRNEWISFIQDLEYCWTSRVMEYLKSRAMQLRRETCTGSLTIKDEWKFAKLGRQIMHAAGEVIQMNTNIDQSEWVQFSPRLVTSEIQEVINQLEEDYSAFQAVVYTAREVDEPFTLWYLLWRNLKKTLHIFRSHVGSVPNRNYAFETTFFTDSYIEKTFDWISSRPEFFSLHEIEDLVGQYCKWVEECADRSQVSADDLRKIRTSPDARQMFLQILTDVSDRQEWASEVPNAMRFAALRLNHLVGQPLTLRRLGQTIEVFLADDLPMNTTWEDDDGLQKDLIRLPPYPTFACTSSTPCRQQDARTETGIPYLAELNQAINSISPGQVIRGSLSVQASSSDKDGTSSVTNDTPSLNLNRDDESAAYQEQIPRGRNIISAYDYVYCPMPENRAFEVANSRLITRDLKDPGWVSEGLRFEDVINLPPPHCQTPGTWTMWEKRLPLGPYEVAKWIWLYTFGSSSKKSRVAAQRPLSPPSVTSRRECRHHKHKRVHNAKTRVTRPTVHRKLGLRGGGPRYVPGHDESPSRKPRQPGSPSNRSDSNVRGHFLNQQFQTPGNNSDNNPRPSISLLTNENQSPNEPLQNNLDPPRIPLHEIWNGRGKENHGRSTSSPGDPPGWTSHSRLCHPCPIYKGEYHHICQRTCAGTPMQIEFIPENSLNDEELLRGSLWYVVGTTYRRRSDQRSLEELATQVQSDIKDGMIREYRVSNGTIIKMSRTSGAHLIVEIMSPPRAAWLPFTGNIDPDGFWASQFRTLDRLPQGLLSVDKKVLGEESFTPMTDLASVPELDVFLSARWTNGTRFRFNTGGTPIITRLERLRRPPWERLQVESGVELAADIHIRDFDAPDFDDIPSNGRNLTGEQAIANFHNRFLRQKAVRDRQKQAKDADVVEEVPAEEEERTSNADVRPAEDDVSDQAAIQLNQGIEMYGSLANPPNAFHATSRAQNLSPTQGEALTQTAVKEQVVETASMTPTVIGGEAEAEDRPDESPEEDKDGSDDEGGRPTAPPNPPRKKGAPTRLSPPKLRARKKVQNANSDDQTQKAGTTSATPATTTTKSKAATQRGGTDAKTAKAAGAGKARVADNTNANKAPVNKPKRKKRAAVDESEDELAGDEDEEGDGDGDYQPPLKKVKTAKGGPKKAIRTNKKVGKT